jgi:hypothetical protein
MKKPAAMRAFFVRVKRVGLGYKSRQQFHVIASLHCSMAMHPRYSQL